MLEEKLGIIIIIICQSIIMMTMPHFFSDIIYMLACNALTKSQCMLCFRCSDGGLIEMGRRRSNGMETLGLRI